jgi:predicted RND superfamily exporter protein
VPSDAARPIAVVVSGQPVIQQAMADSGLRNQILWMAISLPLSLLILGVVLKSLVAALIGLLPAALTLLVTFGLMGLLPERLPMDIAASMLASIALGVGLDYAIHVLWRHRPSDPDEASAAAGPAVAISAIEVTGGFGVLAFASIAPVARFGLLTAETLLVAALATLVLLPALLTWWNPRRPPAPSS